MLYAEWMVCKTEFTHWGAFMWSTVEGKCRFCSAEAETADYSGHSRNSCPLVLPPYRSNGRCWRRPRCWTWPCRSTLLRCSSRWFQGCTRQRENSLPPGPEPLHPTRQNHPQMPPQHGCLFYLPCRYACKMRCCRLGKVNGRQCLDIRVDEHTLEQVALEIMIEELSPDFLLTTKWELFVL